MEELLKSWEKELKALQKQRKEYLNIPLREYELRRDDIRKEFAVVCGKGQMLENCINELKEAMKEVK